VEAADYDGGTSDQRTGIEWLSTDLETSLKVHSFVTVRYPKGHPSHGFGEWMHAYWVRQFGFSRTMTHMKGMALLELS
jgi:hypothetical protein